MAYQVETGQFSGPFDLLLQLVEKEKLDITEISLSKVTDEFLKYLGDIEQSHPDELADFLDIAARLVLLKSKLLIPGAESEEEEETLIDQLKVYRHYALAAKKINRIFVNSDYAFAKNKISLKNIPELSLNIEISPNLLKRVFKNIISAVTNQTKLSQKIIRRKIVSLKEKIAELLNLIKKHREIVFNHIISQKSKVEQGVAFLAVLELMKERRIAVSQEGLFKEIVIKKLM